MDKCPLGELPREAYHLLGFEADDARNKGNERVVSALHDIFPGVEFGSALTDENISRVGDLSSEEFYAEPLGSRVTAEGG